MNIHNIMQSSQEWHELRKKYYKTASRTPVIMGVSPFSTKEKLAEEIKYDIKPYQTKAMQDGNDYEQRARELANKHFKEEFEPVVCTSGEYLASLDGTDFLFRKIIEIKVSESLYNDIRNGGEVPKHYYLQIQHQMMVLNAYEAYLIVYSIELDKIVVSKPIISGTVAQQEIKKAWSEFDIFLSEYQGVPEITDNKALEYANEYKRTVQDIKELEETQELLKKKLFKFVQGDKAKIGDLSIYKSSGKTTWEYAKFIKDNNLELDAKYKKVGNDFYKISVKSA